MEPTPFGRYVLEDRLAVGGMAEVFLASMTGPGGFKKSVVVKRLFPKYARRPDVVTMFLREGRLTGRFKHPNLIQVYELLEVDGQYAIAMEHLEGVDLGQLLSRAVDRRVAITDAIAARMIAGAAAGLHAAHELVDDDGQSLKIVHRDISPTNLFVTGQGMVKVVDFGIAVARDKVDLTKAGVLKGKIGYMAPEQARGEPLDRRSDVYALGVVLYELLSRKRCFAGDDQLAVLGRVREGKYVPLASHRPDCDPELLRLVEYMLQVNANERPQTCDVVRREAARIATQLGCHGDDDVVTLMTRLFPHRDRETRRPPTAMRDVATTDVAGLRSQQTRRALAVAIAVAFLATSLVVLAAVRHSEPQHPTASAVTVAPLVTTPVPLPAVAEPLHVEAMPAAPLLSSPSPTSARRSEERSARLSLTSVPSAAVFVNGSPLGRTPLVDKRVDTGKLVVRLRDEESGLDTTLRLDARAGENIKRDLVFQRGTVVVDVQPWADVYLGAKKLGSTPLPPTSLYEGVYALRLVNPELHRERTVSVTVSPGRTSKVTETLK